ncbi:hypothetical protein [Nonomuraea salmonea]|uniref:hypothetical protein n=1 Tax=Nonomuraea salmonea TaxID=46181 RepID=UPI002FEA971B
MASAFLVAPGSKAEPKTAAASVLRAGGLGGVVAAGLVVPAAVEEGVEGVPVGAGAGDDGFERGVRPRVPGLGGAQPGDVEAVLAGDLDAGAHGAGG